MVLFTVDSTAKGVVIDSPRSEKQQPKKQVLSYAPVANFSDPRSAATAKCLANDIFASVLALPCLGNGASTAGESNDTSVTMGRLAATTCSAQRATTTEARELMTRCSRRLRTAPCTRSTCTVAVSPRCSRIIGEPQTFSRQLPVPTSSHRDSCGRRQLADASLGRLPSQCQRTHGGLRLASWTTSLRALWPVLQVRQGDAPKWRL